MRNASLIFLVLIVLLCGAAVEAEAFGRIMHPTQKLNIRADRSVQSPLLGSLFLGQPVRAADSKGGFVAIYEPSAKAKTAEALLGYAAERFLTDAKPSAPAPEWGMLAYTTRNVNIRRNPSLSGQKLGLVVADEIVRIGPPKDEWTLVFPKDATIYSRRNAFGYASSRFFYDAASKRLATEAAVTREVVLDSGQGEVGGAVAPPPTKAAQTSEWGEVVTLTRRVNLRDGRSVGAKHLRTLRPGEAVRVDFLQNGWYAVFREGETVRDESRALGYAVQRLLMEPQQAVDNEPVENLAAKLTESKPQQVIVESAQIDVAKPLVVQTPDSPSETGRTRTAPAAKPKIAVTPPQEQQTVSIDRTKFQPSKRADPTPDRSVHGFDYRLLEKSETKKLGETWITLKVFLSTTKLPSDDNLRDFATTLWKEYRRSNRNLVVLVYLPGMNTDDLSYGVISFDDQELLEQWVRKTTLFGTEFL